MSDFGALGRGSAWQDIEARVRGNARNIPQDLGFLAERRIRAAIDQRTARATWTSWSTDLLAVLDKEGIYPDPVLLREKPFELPLGVVRAGRPHEAESVCDPMHVDIHTDGGQMEGERADQVGRLPPNSGEGQEVVYFGGGPSAETHQDLTSDLGETPCLLAVHAYRIYQLCHEGRIGGAELFSSRDRIEEPFRSRVSDGILRSEGQNTGD